MGTDAPEYRRSIGRWRLIAIILLLLCIGLIVAVIILSVSQYQMVDKHKNPSCTDDEGIINLEEPNNPSVFHDLTAREMKGLTEYLYSQKSLVDPANAKVNSSYVFLAELHLPKKADVLAHLDHNGPQPPREAVVTIFRGDVPRPDIQEIIVSPLPNPTKHTLKRTIPFNFRPINVPEYSGVLDQITNMVHDIAGNAMLESYGAKLKNCGNKCLTFKYISPMSSAVSGENVRKIWFWLSQYVEYYVLHPLDFALLVRLDGPSYTVENVWYNGRNFTTLEKFVDFYDNNIPASEKEKEKVEFPNEKDDLYSKLYLREPSFPSNGKRNPVQIEPDGKRYSINGRHVNYMNWDFDFRMSSAHGPQLYDIRYKNERIVYEAALQELSAFYSGHNPAQRFADFFDTMGLVGPQAKALVPGADCPEHATFISVSHYLEVSKDPVTFKNAFCLFEHNKEMPLRRHHSYSSFMGSFYEGLESVVLILRTMITVINYDYIFDFIFYQNGVMEVKVVSNGYILATAYSPNESKYGFQLQDHLNGNIHLHLFNFKVDIDVKGEKNRYETLDLSMENVPNEYSKRPNAKYYQTKMTKSLKTTELEAAYKFNFESPKYLLFFNEKEKNKYGNPKAYRVHLRGMVKQLLPEGVGNEPALSWSRYQLAVTKHNDSETHSSSLYAIFDVEEPVVQFQKFIDDDDNIVDQDLVTWITMGVQHIPHTEDLPVTHTPGKDVSFFLSPYNYFKEDPAMAARNGIRIEPKDKNDPKAGLKIFRYGEPEKLQCLPSESKYDEQVREDPSIVLEAGASGGTAL